MAVARAVALRSPCSRDKVGAVVVDRDNRIVDTGYNGPPRGFDRRDAHSDDCAIVRAGYPTCTCGVGYANPPQGCEHWCPRAAYLRDTYEQMHGEGYVPDANYDDCPSLHAEANALMFSDRRLREGGTIYVTSPTCYACAKLIANSGLGTVVTVTPEEKHAHRFPRRSIEFMEKCGLTVVIL